MGESCTGEDVGSNEKGIIIFGTSPGVFPLNYYKETLQTI